MNINTKYPRTHLITVSNVAIKASSVLKCIVNILSCANEAAKHTSVQQLTTTAASK